jgi:hypothetical protein
MNSNFIGDNMKNKGIDCPICGIQLDDNHFFPAAFPGVDQDVCCNCDENLSLMFTNFEEKPGNNDGFIVPDNSDRLEQITGRSYRENRLIFYQYVLRKRESDKNLANSELIKELKDEIVKITLALEEGNQ